MTARALKRQPGWRGRFEAEIDAIRRRPFDWSEQHDCVLGLAARIVLAITGEDLAAGFRGSYDNPRAALKSMRAAGFADLREAFAHHLTEDHPSRGATGDLGLVGDATPFGWSAGAISHGRLIVLRAEGVASLSMLDADFIYRVGR